MKLHGNAALSLNKRRLLCRRVVEEQWSLAAAAAAAEVSERTAGKWVRRFRDEGEAGLLDRSSAPHSVHNATPEGRVEAIAALRRLRFIGAQIAELLDMPEKTVAGILTRIGLGRLGRLGLEPARRYERCRPGGDHDRRRSRDPGGRELIPGYAVPMHYVDSVLSRGLLLVVPSVDEIGHDVGYCSRRGAGASRFRLCRIAACCAVLVEPWICLRTGKWVIPGCAGGARSPASRS